MHTVTTIGLAIAQSVFQVHCVVVTVMPDQAGHGAPRQRALRFHLFSGRNRIGKLTADGGRERAAVLVLSGCRRRLLCDLFGPGVTLAQDASVANDLERPSTIAFCCDPLGQPGAGLFRLNASELENCDVAFFREALLYIGFD